MSSHAMPPSLSLPLYITEAGLADASEPDSKRTRYLVGVMQV